MNRLLILILLTPLLTGCADHFDLDRESPFALKAMFTPNSVHLTGGLKLWTITISADG